jgi:hypothetical protein
MVLKTGGPAVLPGTANARASIFCRERRRHMGVVIYIVLTVAIFALLGLVQKLVERL